MRSIITLLLLLSTNAFYAQYEKGTIYFRSGDSLTGYIDANNYPHQYVKFKKTEDSKKKKYDHRKVKKVVMTNEIGFSRIYTYKMTEGRKYPTLLVQKTEGKLLLHSYVAPPKALPTGDRLYGPNALRKLKKKKKIARQTTVKSSSVFGGGLVEAEYYISIGESDFAQKFPDNQLDALKFFNDCPAVMKKIKEKEYFELDKPALVQMYNDNCVFE